MTESIFTTAAKGKMNVDHNGQTLKDVDLPAWFKTLGNNLNDPAGFYSDILNMDEPVQIGIAHVLYDALKIKIRAAVRPNPKPPTEKGGNPIPVSILTDEAAARRRGLEYIPKPVATSDPIGKAEKALEALTDEQKVALAKKYGLI